MPCEQPKAQNCLSTKNAVVLCQSNQLMCIYASYLLCSLISTVPRLCIHPESKQAQNVWYQQDFAPFLIHLWMRRKSATSLSNLWRFIWIATDHPFDTGLLYISGSHPPDRNTAIVLLSDAQSMTTAVPYPNDSHAPISDQPHQMPFRDWHDGLCQCNNDWKTCKTFYDSIFCHCLRTRRFCQ